MNTIVMVDIDGTIADLMTVWLRRYNRRWKDNLKIHQLVDWNIHQFAKKECGKKMYEYIENPNLYKYVKPIPYALDGVNKLRELDFKILYCTHATLGTAGVKFSWLKNNNFWNDNDHYIETKDKFLIKADLIIDDAWHNIENFNGFSILYAQPWNQKYFHKNRMDWIEIINNIEKYKEGTGVS